IVFIPHIFKWYARNENYTLEMLQEKYLPRINNETIPSFIIYDQNDPVGYIQFYKLTNHLPEGMSDYSHPLFDDFMASEMIGIDLFIADVNHLHTGFASMVLMEFIHDYAKGSYKAVLVDPEKTN